MSRSACTFVLGVAAIVAWAVRRERKLDRDSRRPYDWQRDGR